MDYETVHLTQKIVAGLTIRTRNSDPNMTRDIGGLWEKFFSSGTYGSIPNKTGGKTIGLYTNYDNGVDGAYDLTVCCEVNTAENLPDGLQVRTIPEGKYAKFTVHGNMQAIAQFWSELWQRKIDRRFDCDFEEYQEGDDMENMEVHVYISIN